MGNDLPRMTRRHALLALGAACAAPGLGAAATPRGAPALLLAREAQPDIDPAGYLVSEKFDGVRALWDGERLRFRSGRPVAAPVSFLRRLPARPLDGELWLGRGRFEALSGLVRRETPVEHEWRDVKYLVFELPDGAGTFAGRTAEIAALAAKLAWPQLRAVEQGTAADRDGLQRRLESVVRGGGEGLMLHRADAAYATGRSDVLLKLKPVQDADAVVIAHLPGRGRHERRIGALRVRGDDGAVFQIGTGLSDAQRDEPPPLGSLVTYTYRGRTENGLPRFASFLRVRPDA
jgi:DNA ligase-1